MLRVYRQIKSPSNFTKSFSRHAINKPRYVFLVGRNFSITFLVSCCSRGRYLARGLATSARFVHVCSSSSGRLLVYMIWKRRFSCSLDNRSRTAHRHALYLSLCIILFSSWRNAQTIQLIIIFHRRMCTNAFQNPYFS